MPLLSFVLVAHREQAYLGELAASVLEQEFTDVELIAIDDASPDHVPELLDDLAARDPRVRVQHLPERAGLGEGRNLGLAAASGDYVWFVNTTDRLPAGALATVAEHLRSDRPDVTLVANTFTPSLGESRPGAFRKVIARVAERGPGPLGDRPAVAGAAAGIWRKVFRRELLDQLQVSFGRGGHGELPVIWPALLAAERIAALATPAYDRRTPGNAVRDELVEGSPFDVFAAYDAVFAFADSHDGVPDEHRRLILPAMVRHELSLLDKLPEADRPEFFRRMADAHRRHRRGDEPPPASRRERAIQRGSWRRLRMVETLADPPKPRLKRRRKRKPGSGSGMASYYEQRRREPIDPNLAAFGAYWYRGYACNPRAIYERARELVPEMRAVWVVKEEHADDFPADVEHVIAGSEPYWDLIARAGVLVNNVNWPNHLVKREGSVHVMTHHGTPLKWMGLDLQDRRKAGKQTDFPALLRRTQRWDFSIAQNAYTTLIWERVYPTDHETLEVGYPRNDRLANATEDDVERIRAELAIEPGRRTVLYAPTHREYLDEWQPTLDLAALADGLGDDFVIMARLHYLHESDPVLSELHRQGRIRDVADHPTVEELQLAADALVTDYSSIMFDYAVLDRPIVIHAPDWDTYRTRRGTYFDLLEEPPGVVTTTDAEVVDALRSGSAWGEDARQVRAAFRARFASLDDGRAAERVVRRVWLGERMPLAPDRVAGAVT
jgi:CDP-glycerol glycerophosphotransferase